MQKVARILKSHGTDGRMLVSFTGIDPEETNLKEPVFIFDDGLPVPYFFETFEPHGTSRAYVRLTGVRSLSDADALAGKDLYLEDGDEADEEDFTGWTVLDADGNEAGTVTDLEDIPGNPCLVVRTGNGKEALLPLREELLLEVDADARTLMMEIPTGLLQL